MDDDVWGDGSSGDEGGGELDREWRARQGAFHNEGYREGIEEGKGKTVQEGFDVGFREGALAGFAWGEVRGAASTLGIFVGQAAGTSSMRGAVDSITARLDAAGPTAMVAMCKGMMQRDPHEWGGAAEEPRTPAPGGEGGEEEEACGDGLRAAVAEELAGLGVKLGGAPRETGVVVGVSGGVSGGAEGGGGVKVPRTEAKGSPGPSAPPDDDLGW